jgi:hypothetical protein
MISRRLCGLENDIVSGVLDPSRKVIEQFWLAAVRNSGYTMNRVFLLPGSLRE